MKLLNFFTFSIFWIPISMFVDWLDNKYDLGFMDEILGSSDQERKVSLIQLQYISGHWISLNFDFLAELAKVVHHFLRRLQRKPSVAVLLFLFVKLSIIYSKQLTLRLTKSQHSISMPNLDWRTKAADPRIISCVTERAPTLSRFKYVIIFLCLIFAVAIKNQILSLLSYLYVDHNLIATTQ